MNELAHKHTDGGLSTVYAVLHQGANVVRASNGAAVTRSADNWTLGKLAGSDAAAATFYLASVPAGTAAGWYSVQWYLQAGGSPALTDSALAAPVDFYWTGTAVDRPDVDPLANVVPGDYTGNQAGRVLGRLRAASVTIQAPVDVTNGDRLTLYQGDDHAAGDRLPEWQITDYAGPDLDGATAVLRLLRLRRYQTRDASNAAELEVEATLSVDGDTVTVTAAITAAESEDLYTIPGGDDDTHQYQIIATTADDERHTLKMGPARVVRQIDAPAEDE